MLDFGIAIVFFLLAYIGYKVAVNIDRFLENGGIRPEDERPDTAAQTKDSKERTEVL